MGYSVRTLNAVCGFSLVSGNVCLDLVARVWMCIEGCHLRVIHAVRISCGFFTTAHNFCSASS